MSPGARRADWSSPHLRHEGLSTDVYRGGRMLLQLNAATQADEDVMMKLNSESVG